MCVCVCGVSCGLCVCGGGLDSDTTGMEGRDFTLADVMAALAQQSRQAQDGQERLCAMVSAGFDLVRSEMEASVARVIEEAKEHTKAECRRVKDEVLGEVFTKTEVMAEMEKAVEELRRYVEGAVDVRITPYQVHGCGTGEVKSEPPSECGDSERGESVPSGCKGSVRSSVLTPPLSPSPLHSRASGHSSGSDKRRKYKHGLRHRPQEFDGSVSWEAYKAQFELLADARCWSRSVKALQLVGALKGSALEVLNQLPASKRASYSSVTAALDRRYGHQHQSEVFRARFRARIRGPGEPLTYLAQDLEQLVRRAYPEAGEDMITVLLRDQFVDAVDHPQIRIFIQQARVKNLQEALARGLEMESFMRTSSERSTTSPGSGHMFRARQDRVRTPPPRSSPLSRSPPPPSGIFRGNCFSCGQQGHSKRYCPQGGSSSSSRLGSEGQGQYRYKPCCWHCGQTHRSSDCPHSQALAFKPDLGNWGTGPGTRQQSRGPSPFKVPHHRRSCRAG